MTSDTSTPAPGTPRDEAITRLVDEQAGRLYALGLRFCGNSEEAKDLVQETFLQAYRNWDGFEGRAQASTWLYTIAARVCQRFHRKRAGEPKRLESIDELMPLGDPALAVMPDDPLASEMLREGRERIEEAIAELPLDFRMPLVLKEIVGLPVAEVAKVMNIPAATVKTRLYRARLKVRHALETTLPKREVPPPAYSEQVCLDLLQAKQETLDRGEEYEFPPGVICERCAEFFATLDLATGLCRDIGRGELPEEVRRVVLERLQSEA